MTPEQIRALGAQMMIATAVSGGLYAMVADPLRNKAATVEAKLATIVKDHSSAESTLANLPQIVTTRDETQRCASIYEERSLPARDESAMFSQIMDMSKRSGVVIDQITPTKTRSSLDDKKDEELIRPGDVSVRYALSGNGSYSATAKFLEELQDDWGYCVLKNIRLTPEFHSDENSVKFSMVVELFSFDARPFTQGDVIEENTP